MGSTFEPPPCNSNICFSFVYLKSVVDSICIGLFVSPRSDMGSHVSSDGPSVCLGGHMRPSNFLKESFNKGFRALPHIPHKDFTCYHCDVVLFR